MQSCGFLGILILQTDHTLFELREQILLQNENELHLEISKTAISALPMGLFCVGVITGNC